MGEEDEKELKKAGEEEKSTGEKSREAVQDTANAAKDGVSLAKNIASQNYVGVAKDAVNLLKNKQVRKILLAALLAPIIIIVLLVGSLFAIFNSVGEAIQGAINSATEWFNNNYMYGVLFYTDEQLDTVIKYIENLGVDLDDLNLMGDIDYDKDDPDRKEKEKEALKKYLIKFLVAQEKLRTLNPGERSILNPKDWDNMLIESKVNQAMSVTGSNQQLEYGNVKIYRVHDDEFNYNKQLEYLYYDNLKNENGEISITDDFYENNYTVDSEGNLAYAVKKTVEKAYTTYIDGVIEQTKTEPTSTTYELVSVDYKQLLDPYTTSVQFLIYLTMVTQNPEFASKVAEEAATGEIKIVIMDEYQEKYEVNSEEYTLNTKTRDDDGNEGVTSTIKGNKREERTCEYTPKVVITYADTWFAKQEITYTKQETEPTVIESVDTPIPDENEPSLLEAGTMGWHTNQKKKKEVTVKKTEYVESVYGDVEYKTDEFIDWLNEEYHIPNTTRKESPKDNFISGADWLLGLLQIDSRSQKMEQVIRMILNKCTNSDKYGDGSIDSLIDGNEILESYDYIVDIEKAPELCINDKETLEDALNQVDFNNEQKQNLISEIDGFLEMQEKYGVNAIFAMAVTMTESGAGTNWAAIDQSTHNWYSITGSYNGNTYHNPNSGNELTWRVYTSYKEATLDFGDLIKNSSYYFKNNNYSVGKIGPSYCNKDWSIVVASYMKQIFIAAGIEK